MAQLDRSTGSVQQEGSPTPLGDPAGSMLGKRGRTDAQVPVVLNIDQQFTKSESLGDCLARGLCYVDRTQYLSHIVRQERVAFLRPRRFGKSLWVSTIDEFFSGRTDTFRGLAVYDEEITLKCEGGSFTWCPADPEKHTFVACPVVKFNFSALIGEGTHDKIEDVIKDMIEETGLLNGVALERKSIGTMLRRLIQTLAAAESNPWRKVVVLIDEYDALWRKLVGPSYDEAIHKLLKGFYSTLKLMSGFIFLTFVTGITPLALTGLTSGPNDIDDYSLDPKLATLCGFTQAEVEHVFQAKGLEFDMDYVQQQYNGYCWDVKNVRNTVYNPFVIGKICNHRKLGTYSTDTSSESVIRLLRNPCMQLSFPAHISRNTIKRVLPQLDTEDGARVLLLYAGYATIVNVEDAELNDEEYTLDYPNEEAKRFVIEEQIDDRQYVAALYHDQPPYRTIYKYGVVCNGESASAELLMDADKNLIPIPASFDVAAPSAAAEQQEEPDAVHPVALSVVKKVKKAK